MNVLCLSFSSSLKTDIPFCFKPIYRWFVNVLRVSSLLKLRNTSNFHLLEEEEEVEEEEDNDDDGRRAIKEMDELEQ